LNKHSTNNGLVGLSRLNHCIACIQELQQFSLAFNQRMGSKMSSPAPVQNAAPSIDDTIVIHSPAILHGKTSKWTTRTVNCRASWKSKMQSYLETLFGQLFLYDCMSLGEVFDKYLRVISGAGIPYRFVNANKRHVNALREIEKLIAPNGLVCEENFLCVYLYADAVKLLDKYAKQQRYEDFEEIAFILTIIINTPNISRMQTRW